jgi:hypothetical protein
MLKPQSTELPHEVEYALDVAVDGCEIDAGTRIVLVVYGDRRRVSGIINNDDADIGAITVPLPDESHRRIVLDRRGIARACIAYANELLGQLKDEHKIAAGDLAVSQVVHKVRDMAWTFNYWAITDLCEGGAMLPFRTRGSGRTMLDGLWGDERPTPKTLRRLHGRKWIRRYVSRAHEAHDMRYLLSVAASRACPGASASAVSASAGIFDAAYAEHRRRFYAASRRGWSAMLGDAARGRQSPAAQQEARKVAKRSAAFAASVVGAGEVSKFIRGEDVFLEGDTVTLKVGKRASLLAGSTGSHALEVSVADKQTRQDLASLCVYMKGAPPLDQLAGFALAMQAGEESAILADANIIQVTAAGAAHPSLAGRHSQRDQDGFPRIRRVRMQPKEHRNREHWDATKEIWMDELGTFVFGPSWRRISA